MASIDQDGRIDIPSCILPLPVSMSQESKQAIIRALTAPPIRPPSVEEMARIKSPEDYAAYVLAYRLKLDEGLARPLAEQIASKFDVDISPDKIEGVPVERIKPRAGVTARNGKRVLLNLHGGGFMSGALHLGRVESIPIAAELGAQVIAVNYRQAHEHSFPAATDDALSVYRALLRDYPAGNIGVFGCSAGGALTAQFVVAALKSGLSAPGAIGMFGAGAETTPRGDLSFLAAVGCAEAPEAGGDLPPRSPFGYFSTAKPDDPVAYPLTAGGAYLGRFPPTIILTGTRAFDANAALATHRALSRAGVDASLQLFDGMRHCFIYHVDNPESQDARTMIARFFDKHLGA